MQIRTTQTGLEPVTSAVTGRRSNQLSHWARSKFARKLGSGFNTLKTEYKILLPKRLYQALIASGGLTN